MSSLFGKIQQLEQDLLRRPATLQEVLPGAPQDSRDLLNSIKVGDRLCFTGKAKQNSGASGWDTVVKVVTDYPSGVPRFKVGSRDGDWHPYWFGLTDEEGLCLMPGAEERIERYPWAEPDFKPEDSGCVSCGAPVETEQESADSWAAVEAVEAVGAPRCLTEKQVFVMSYLAVRAHSFRTIEGFIDSEVMAAIHRDAEKLWDMLQKGLEKG